MRITPKTPYWRIEDPNSSLAVRFRSIAAPAAEAPVIVPDLAPRHQASILPTREIAEACFAKHLRGMALEIVRIDCAEAA
jgi:hypothetical protein